MPFFDAGDARLFYTDDGDGEDPVVFIHGWTCDSHDWSWQLPSFLERHRVIALDLRHHGRSSSTGDHWDPRQLAGDVRQLLASIGCSHPVVVGHSLGAMVASALVVDHPDTVRAIVAVEPAYGVTGVLAETITSLFDVMRDSEAATITAAVLSQSDTSKTPAFLSTWHRRRIAGMDPGVVGSVFNAMYEPTDQFGFRPASDQYLRLRTCPVLAIHVDPDRARWEESLNEDPFSRTVVWEGHGHWPHQEAAPEFNELVLGWIDGLSGSS